MQQQYNKKGVEKDDKKDRMDIDWEGRVDAAKTMDELDELTRELKGASLRQGTETLILKIIDYRRETLDRLKNINDIRRERRENKDQMNGVFFADTSQVWRSFSELLPPYNELMESFCRVQRKETPEFYKDIVDMAEELVNGKGENKGKRFLHEPTWNPSGPTAHYPRRTRISLGNPSTSQELMSFQIRKPVLQLTG